MVQIDASGEVDDAFPDALKGPILRKVQFSTISRLDHLGMPVNVNSPRSIANA